MHFGNLESTQEARAALGYGLIELQRIYRAQTDRETDKQFIYTRNLFNYNELFSKKAVFIE